MKRYIYPVDYCHDYEDCGVMTIKTIVMTIKTIGMTSMTMVMTMNYRKDY